VQRAAFLADPYPSIEQRRGHLLAVAGMVTGHREQIRAALVADFAVAPELFTDLAEVLGVAGRAAHAAEQLSIWTAEDERPTEPAVYGTTRAGVRFQPKGVVGNIVPWNFPFDLSLGPLVEMLAAGNRVIMKPSDHTPACAALLAEMVGKTFGEDRVAVSVGGLVLAKEFPTLRWDHLLYTGSPAIGREVAVAAAQNLVPVTLELGGKSPAILTSGHVTAENVRTTVGTKLIRNGQMCTSVDYALVPRAELDTFVEHARSFVDGELPGYASSEDCTGIITQRHLERIAAMVAEAEASGATVVPLGGEGNRERRQLPLTLVVDPPDDLRIMQEEIFGPILAVVPFDDLDDALAHINAGERPLSVYVFADDATADRVLTMTTSGGACVNVCAAQGALPSLGFGGIGQSGSGRHHGLDGFREFSNPRGVVVRGTGDVIDSFFPPYGALAQAVVDSALAGPSAAEDVTARGSV